MKKKWKAEGRPMLHIGVGLTTCVASVGNMGPDANWDGVYVMMHK